MSSVKNLLSVWLRSVISFLWMGDALKRDDAFNLFRQRDLETYIRIGAIPLLVMVYAFAGLHTWLYADTLSDADAKLWQVGTTLVCLAVTIPVLLVFSATGRKHYDLLAAGFSAIVLVKVAVMPQLISHTGAARAESFFCVLAVLIIYLALRLSLRHLVAIFLASTLLSLVLIFTLAQHTPDWGWYFYYFLAVSAVCIKVSHLQITMERRAFDQSLVIEAQNHRLEAMANQDALTGLANRRVFDQAIAREWTRHQRHQRTFAVLYIDVDYFKPYNDNYGHQQGDVCLAQVAAQIRHSLLRAADLPARYGGEEFVVLLPEIDLSGAEEVAQRIRDAVEQKAILHKISPIGVVTLSIGVASGVPVEGSEPRHLIAQADKALYAAKQSGRNRVMTANWPEEDPQRSVVDF